ncbi:MAG: ABC-2 family transporter protein [Spirochaetes bacterium]|nr:ABC-2 family transporter protein [Spirochaetota bacterium]
MSAFREVKSHLVLLRKYFKFNLAASMEYRTMFITQVIGMALNNSVFIAFWFLIFKNTGNIGTYGFNDIMFIWAVSSSAFGIAHIVFGNCRNLADQIQKGELDVFLLQPKNPLFSILASRTIVSAWGDFLYGYTIILVFFGFSVFKILLFSFLVVSGGIIYVTVFSMAESLTFFMGNSKSISQMISEFLISFSIYPESIFGDKIRWLFYTLIPAGFISFVPKKIFMNSSYLLILLLLVVDIFFILLNSLVFKLGLKRYESGNLIGTRL